MPVVRYALSAAARGLGAFLNLEAGVVRADAAPFSESQRTEPGKQGEVERLRGLLVAKDRQIAALRAGTIGGVKPDNVVWIFGTGRSGNTWLSSMMEDLGHSVWREPSVGRLFGEFYYLHSREGQRGTGNFILGEKHRRTWLRSIRTFVLEGAGGRFPNVGDGFLVIKEQVGSVGAPLLMEALPESRMILLIRDPRDVVASWMDATRKGGWRRNRLDKSGPDTEPDADQDPTAFVEERASIYLRSVNKAREAYESHRGTKVLVRYEDLRMDALDTVRRIHFELGMELDEGKLAETVKKHAWENVPEDEKGRGKFHRKATPGGWKEDLSAEQRKVVEEITGPLLTEFYSA